VSPCLCLTVSTLSFLLRENHPLSFILIVTFSVIFLFVIQLVHNSPAHLYSGFILILSIFIGVFIATSSLIVFFISYELSMFPVCLLILFYGYQPERLAALV